MSYLWRRFSFIIVFISIIFVMGMYILYHDATADQTNITITVQDGESLWSISEQYAKAIGIPTSKFVHLIEKENQLYGQVIKSGDQIVIPGEYIKSSPSEVKFAMEEK
ncbi:LysM peptidoglycan-binding domain-containing protein [Lederbergia sp. NSJ-179]|uniref:cell division suppressor protein YneA n=1 Tax=Lederbergia sp. NSJ-179 TaxID=2931402 RepID=UPI001FD1AFAA|nr:LysM peptidoglycan-binding domain-containing protein [Lederbergia sp. NSJ-179]MCJ7841235.1 LysM peptidoglycan-binding domain-containing protein [Lederbergia sp. NSJ-179]